MNSRSARILALAILLIVSEGDADLSIPAAENFVTPFETSSEMTTNQQLQLQPTASYEDNEAPVSKNVEHMLAKAVQAVEVSLEDQSQNYRQRHAYQHRESND